MGKSAKMKMRGTKAQRQSAKVLKNSTDHKSSFPSIPQPLKKQKPKMMDIDEEKIVEPVTDVAIESKKTEKSIPLKKSVKKSGVQKPKAEKTDKAKEKRKNLLQQLTKEEFPSKSRLLDGRPDYVSLWEGKPRVAARNLKGLDA